MSARLNVSGATILGGRGRARSTALGLRPGRSRRRNSRSRRARPPRAARWHLTPRIDDTMTGPPVPDPRKASRTPAPLQEEPRPVRPPAEDAIRKTGVTILVEGYFDVLFPRGVRRRGARAHRVPHRPGHTAAHRERGGDPRVGRAEDRHRPLTVPACSRVARGARPLDVRAADRAADGARHRRAPPRSPGTCEVIPQATSRASEAPRRGVAARLFRRPARLYAASEASSTSYARSRCLDRNRLVSASTCRTRSRDTPQRLPICSSVAGGSCASRL